MFLISETVDHYLMCLPHNTRPASLIIYITIDVHLCNDRWRLDEMHNRHNGSDLMRLGADEYDLMRLGAMDLTS
jgi:hypothetical protein